MLYILNYPISWALVEVDYEMTDYGIFEFGRILTENNANKKKKTKIKPSLILDLASSQEDLLKFFIVY